MHVHARFALLLHLPVCPILTLHTIRCLPSLMHMLMTPLMHVALNSGRLDTVNLLNVQQFSSCNPPRGCSS